MPQSRFVLMVMYDLAFYDKAQQKAYRQLFNHLKKSGFYFLQSSIYIKPLSEKQQAEPLITMIKNIPLESAHIRALVLTHQQFLSMQAVAGADQFGENLVKQPCSVISL